MAINLDPWGLVDDEIYQPFLEQMRASQIAELNEERTDPIGCVCGNCFECCLASPENNYCEACEYGVCHKHRNEDGSSACLCC